MNWRGSLRFSLIVLLGLVAAASAYGAEDPGKLAQGLAAYQREDYTKALELLSPLAEGGEPQASRALAAMFERGLGVPQSYKWAYTWYKRAQNEGTDASTDLKRLATKLSPA